MSDTAPTGIILEAFMQEVEGLPQIGRLSTCEADLASDWDIKRAVKATMRGAVDLGKGSSVPIAGTRNGDIPGMIMDWAINVRVMIRYPIITARSGIAFENDVYVPLIRSIAGSALLRTVSQMWYPSGRQTVQMGGTVPTQVSELMWTVNYKGRHVLPSAMV